MRWRRNRKPEKKDAPAPSPGRDARAVDAELAEAVPALYRANESGSPVTLRAAVEALRRAVARAPRGDPNRGIGYSALSDGLRFLFQMTGRGSDLDAAVEWGDKAAAAVPRDDPQYPKVLNKLAERRVTRFARAGAPADLKVAVTRSKESLKLAEPGTDDHTEALFRLGLAFQRHYEGGGGAAAREAMIEWYERALATPAPVSWNRSVVLSQVVVGYRDRFRESGAPEDLDRAVERAERALTEAPAGPSHHRDLLIDLASLYNDRFDLSGAPQDADATIRHITGALAATGADHSSRPVLLRLTVQSFARRFRISGDVADLDACVTYGEQAVAALAPGGPERPRVLADLSADHVERYRSAGDPADLDAAVARGEQALSACPAGHPDRRRILSRLAEAHHARYDHRGGPGDLDAVIDLSEQALRLASPEFRGAALINLATGYGMRYRRTGDPGDLDRCVEASEEALADPGTGAQERATCLGNLSVAHRNRYQHFGARADLDHAIDLGHRAVEALGAGHLQRASRLDSLASSYAARFEHSREHADLDTAVALGHEALGCTRAGPAERRLIQSNLAAHLLHRFDAARDLADLEAGIVLGREALGATPPGSPERARIASALAGALLRRHQSGTGPRTGLREAVEHIEQAVAATAPDSPELLDRLQNLAVAYREQHERGDGVPADAVTRLVEAAPRAAVAAPPVSRATGQLNIGLLALSMGLLPEAARMLRAAVEALPECAAQGLAWSDQEQAIVGSRGLVGEATAAHLALGDVEGAVELAELGRGVLLSRRLDARGDVTELAAVSPELADRFEQLGAELDRRSWSTGDESGGASTVRRSPHDIAERWDGLLDRIRDLPGFSGFLRPPRIADLRRAATGGTVVLVTVSSLGGDAVLLRPDGVDRVPLPRLTRHDAETHAHALAGLEPVPGEEGRVVTYVGSGGATPELLEWLWETIAGPVLAALGHTGPSSAGGPLPRVWWVPAGPLGLLPLHAAGVRGGPSALDRVVSSYTPTVRALLHARRRPVAETRTQLAVTMRHTPGMADLTGTAAEAAQLLAGRADAVALTDGDATADAVLRALPDADWVHFACHASGHPVTPSRSRLHLYDAPLPVPEISRLGLRSGELAYLSACSTGQAGVFHADEAIHLASAFQLAGYRHVVATLWPVDDTVAAMAARRFYRLLGDSPTADGAAHALHETTCRLRDRFPDAPDLWAPFVHSGP
ncbi:CHAT domain-containing protein [Streptomyces sp. ST1015]|uniref:CHAT domain-containing protein n=1 Tax=unclassified Streptomyces TaxID=2593676 RepID=UPI001CA7B1C0|nr:CHAT domain-containing protein [Streptomyces sp. ST1015]QZZ25188.1 CHAT domain-containing protein [Streptomyces sp. ST1015]